MHELRWNERLLLVPAHLRKIQKGALGPKAVCDTTWIQPKKLLRHWGFSQVILAIGHSGLLGRSEGWSDGRRNVSKDLDFARLGPQAVVVSLQTRHKISIYEQYLEQIARPL